MSITVHRQTTVPPGFRFHPTEEELLNYYLRKKVAYEKIDMDVIKDVDLNKLEPWDIQEKCSIGSMPQNDWYFYSHKDKKYPTGTRTNRATAAGFWKATGRDKVIYSSSRRIGMRKTLVFYRGRAPHGQKSDWIMHEYRLDDHQSDHPSPQSAVGMGADMVQEDGWVVCRVFKKKNHHHRKIEEPSTEASSTNTSSSPMSPVADTALDQILHYMSRPCKQETTQNLMIMQQQPLPQLQSLPQFPTIDRHQLSRRFSCAAFTDPTTCAINHDFPDPYVAAPTPSSEHSITDWAMLDRLVASHLNGQDETMKQFGCFNAQSGFLSHTPETDLHFPRMISSARPSHHDYSGDGDLWTFTGNRSSPDPLIHSLPTGFASTAPI